MRKENAQKLYILLLCCLPSCSPAKLTRTCTKMHIPCHSGAICVMPDWGCSSQNRCNPILSAERKSHLQQGKHYNPVFWQCPKTVLRQPLRSKYWYYLHYSFKVLYCTNAALKRRFCFQKGIIAGSIVILHMQKRRKARSCTGRSGNSVNRRAFSSDEQQ